MTKRASKRKQPIFFIHIPKTAGTSLRVALERDLGERLVQLYEDQPGNGRDEVAGRGLASDAVVFGHFQFGVHERFGAKPCYATVLRHPIDRVVSWYRYQGSDPELPHYDAVRQASLRELLEAGYSPELSNHMTATLAGRNVRGPDDAAAYAAAMANFRHFRFVALVETLEEDIPALEEVLDVELPHLPRINVTNSRPRDTHDWLHEVIRQNLLDLRIYEFVRRMRAAMLNGGRRARTA